MTRHDFIVALGASCGMFALAPRMLCAALDPKRAARPRGHPLTNGRNKGIVRDDL